MLGGNNHQPRLVRKVRDGVEGATGLDCMGRRSRNGRVADQATYGLEILVRAGHASWPSHLM